MGASTSDLTSSQNYSLVHDLYIIRPISVHSQEHHQELISLTTKFKQFKCKHIVKLIDSHSVQAHNLCSVISQLYLVLEKPKYTLDTFLQKIKRLNNQQVKSILVGCARGIQFLLRQGLQMKFIDESCIFIEEDIMGDLIAKVMPPLCWQDTWSDQKAVQMQLGEILMKYIDNKDQGNVYQLVQELASGQVSFRQIEEMLGERKKSKAGLKLTKGVKGSQTKRQSMVSNGSSLMIDSGDVSDLMFRHFYQNFNDSISEIPSQESLVNETLIEQSHQFPKKYLKSRAFRKDKWSIWKSEGQNLTRDQSMKENMNGKLELNPFLLESAKLTESFVTSSYR